MKKTKIIGVKIINDKMHFLEIVQFTSVTHVVVTGTEINEFNELCYLILTRSQFYYTSDPIKWRHCSEKIDRYPESYIEGIKDPKINLLIKDYNEL